jgi:genome maintenance exonuclease 1
MITNKYPYTEIKRTRVEGKRLYDTETGFLPSVTTILDKTKPARDRQALQNWRNRVGPVVAQQITTEAAGVGTLMHKYLEDWCIHDKYERADNLVHRTAGKMADTVIENIAPHLDEVWGTEVNLYYPGLYAGTIDLPGVWKGEEAIMDFKQSNKLKKREWISDYFCQAAMYGQAHNELFGTNISTIAIFMCTRACEFQLFEAVGDEYEYWVSQANARVAEYYGV